jgi:uncharacterized protein
MFVDSSYIVALVNDRDQNHERAKRLALAFRGRPGFTTDAVLLEVGNSLSRRFRRQAVQVIRGLLESDDIQVVPLSLELFNEGLTLYEQRPDKEWGLVDCISFVVMKREGLTDALAFDQHFTQAGFRTL